MLYNMHESWNNRHFNKLICLNRSTFNFYNIYVMYIIFNTHDDNVLKHLKYKKELHSVRFNIISYSTTSIQINIKTNWCYFNWRKSFSALRTIFESVVSKVGSTEYRTIPDRTIPNQNYPNTSQHRHILTRAPRPPSTNVRPVARPLISKIFSCTV